MIESIYKSYPFCENWEKKHCKSVIEEAYQWGEQLKKKNIKQSNVFLMTLDTLGNYNIIKKE